MPYPIAEHKTKIHADLGDFQFDHLFNFVGFCCCCPWNSWSDGSQPIQLQSQGLVFFGWEKIGLLHPDRAQKPRKKLFWRWWKLAYEMLKIRLLFKKEQSSISVMLVNLCQSSPSTNNNQQPTTKICYRIRNPRQQKNAQNRDLPLAICQRFIWQMHQHLGKTQLTRGKIPGKFWSPKKTGSVWSFLNLIFWDVHEFQWFMVIFGIYGYADVWWF